MKQKEPPRYHSEAAPKLKITIKRVQNRARMALPSVSDFGKANVTMMLMTTIVLLHVRTHARYIYR